MESKSSKKKLVQTRRLDPAALSARPPADPKSRRQAVVLGILLLVTALAYGNSLQNQFTFDDEVVIARNPLIKRVHYLPQLLASDYWAGARDPASTPRIRMGLYRPLVLLSYAANYAVGGLSAPGYHLVNVLLHVIVSWLLYLLALELGLSSLAALAAAILFAVHPIHTEAVAGIVGRAELMMSLGVLASLWCAIRGRLGWSLFAFALGLFSKEQAVVLPALLVLYDLCVGKSFAGGLLSGPTARRLVSRYASYILVLAVYGIIRWWALGGASSPPTFFLDNPLAYLEWKTRLLNVVMVAGRYLWLCLWPASLSADYSYNSIPLSNSLLRMDAAAAVLAWGSLFGLAFWSYFRKPHVCFSIGFLMLTFFPASNLLIPIGTIMGERLFYLPSAGLCLLIAAGCDRLAREGKTMSAAGLVVLSILGITLMARTIMRNRDWSDTERMARSALKIVPNNAKIHSILGRLAKDSARWDDAIEHFRTALKIYPDYSRFDVTLNTNLGISLFEKGHLTEGTRAFERAVALDPGWSLLHYNLAFAYARQGLNRNAEAHYRQALRLNREDPKAYTGLGYLFLNEKRYEDALAAADEALKQSQDYVEAHFVRARALRAIGRLQESARALERILILDPTREAIRGELEALRASREAVQATGRPAHGIPAVPVR